MTTLSHPTFTMPFSKRYTKTTTKLSERQKELLTSACAIGEEITFSQLQHYHPTTNGMCEDPTDKSICKSIYIVISTSNPYTDSIVTKDSIWYCPSYSRTGGNLALYNNISRNKPVRVYFRLAVGYDHPPVNLSLGTYTVESYTNNKFVLQRLL